MRLLGWLLSVSLLFPATMRGVKFVRGKNYARVILRLSSPVKYEVGKIKRKGKTLLYVDLYGTNPGRVKSRYYFESNLIELVRIARKDMKRERAVIHLRNFSYYRVFYLPSPPRVVIDIFGKKEIKEEFTLSKQLGLKIKKIAIDPGHGGKDPGCINERLGLREKDIALDIALTLKELLENGGYQVILTRKNDSYLSLEERPAIANSEGADLFISIHVNWAKRSSARGIEAFYLNFATDSESERVAAKENETSSKSLSQLKGILKKIALNEKVRESKALSSFIQRGIVSNMKKFYKGIKDLGVKGAPFFVLVGAEMPATLIEVSFLSNSVEGKRLSTQIYRTRLAYGIYLGIENFVKSLEEK